MEFTGYHLKRNPFIWRKDLYLEYDQEVELEKFFYQKVINNLWDKIVERWEKGNIEPIWIWHDNILLEHRIGVFGGLFRTMVISENPKIFPVDVPVAFSRGNFLRDVYKLFLSRLTEERLKNTFYSFLKASLEKDNVYVSQENKEAIFKGLEEEGFKYFEKVTLSEEKDEEIVEELLKLTQAYFEGIKAGPALQRVAEIFLKLGFKDALNSLIPVNPEEDLVGLVNFLRSFYDLVVIFINDVENLELREFPNKSNVIGGLSQLEALMEKKALLIYFSLPLVKETLGKKMASRFDQFSYELNLSSYQKEALSPEEVKGLLVEFLSSDEKWLKEKESSLKTWPFAESSLEYIYQESGGNPIKVLEIAGRLVEEGRERGYPVIEREFAEKVISREER